MFDLLCRSQRVRAASVAAAFVLYQRPTRLDLRGARVDGEQLVRALHAPVDVCELDLRGCDMVSAEHALRIVQRMRVVRSVRLARWHASTPLWTYLALPSVKAHLAALDLHVLRTPLDACAGVLRDAPALADVTLRDLLPPPGVDTWAWLADALANAPLERLRVHSCSGTHEPLGKTLRVFLERQPRLRTLSLRRWPAIVIAVVLHVLAERAATAEATPGLTVPVERLTLAALGMHPLDRVVLALPRGLRKVRISEANLGVAKNAHEVFAACADTLERIDITDARTGTQWWYAVASVCTALV